MVSPTVSTILLHHFNKCNRSGISLFLYRPLFQSGITTKKTNDRIRRQRNNNWIKFRHFSQHIFIPYQSLLIAPCRLCRASRSVCLQRTGSSTRNIRNKYGKFELKGRTRFFHSFQFFLTCKEQKTSRNVGEKNNRIHPGSIQFILSSRNLLFKERVRLLVLYPLLARCIKSISI